MQSSANINLLKNKENFLDEALRWALSVGRLLVIIAEIVAFSSFIYRFSLDRTLIDLHSKVNQEQAIVASLKDQETKYRNLQERISLATKISNSGNKSVKIFNEVADLTPDDITYNTLAIEGDVIRINASVKSISSLTQLMESLRKYPQISSVNIDSITNKTTDSSIEAFITAKLKGGSDTP